MKPILTFIFVSNFLLKIINIAKNDVNVSFKPAFTHDIAKLMSQWSWPWF